MADEVTLRVTEQFDGERVDKTLASLLDISRTVAKRLLDVGVTLDGARARPADRVTAGAVLVAPEPPSAHALAPEPVEFGILHEDEHLVVVDKPPGLVVHPGSGQRRGTLAAGLLHRYPDLEGVGAPDRWGLVHRLDKETSGTLLVGRTPESYEDLVDQLRRRTIARRYLALVDGFLEAPTGTIEAPIGRDPARPTRRAVVATGKHARTHFETVEVFPDAVASLLEVRLETGRTHQIRVHLAAIDHPVIGDRLYGRGQTVARSDRVFLHAASVTFDHPETGSEMTVASPLPKDLDSRLQAIRAASAE